MPHSEQPRESDLELVVSLSGDDVAAVNAALLQHVTGSWLPALSVVTNAHHSLLPTLPLIPQAFFSYRLRKLVGSGEVQANGVVTRELAYLVKAADHGAAA